MEDVFRKEIKYVILKSEFYGIKRHLDALMKADIHSDMDGYMVRSLYFDSLYDRDLYDTIDGNMEKQKIRLRTYSLEDERIKLEYKCKSGSDCQKYSLSITKDEAMKMERGEFGFLHNYDNPLAYKLYQKLIQGLYRPKTVVEYQRKAYVFPVSDARITYDTNVRATGIPFGFFQQDPSYFPLLPSDRGVLEIKYNAFLPYPLKKVVEFIDRTPTANSKYGQARFIN